MGNEIITFKELVERHKDIKKEKLFRLILVCKNCKHKDLCGNFVRKRPDVQADTQLVDWERYGKQELSDEDGDYKDFFFCPKCNSSLVCLDPKFTKNNILRIMEEES